jgi:hypothetical protein
VQEHFDRTPVEAIKRCIRFSSVGCVCQPEGAVWAYHRLARLGWCHCPRSTQSVHASASYVMQIQLHSGIPLCPTMHKQHCTSCIDQVTLTYQRDSTFHSGCMPIKPDPQGAKALAQTAHVQKLKPCAPTDNPQALAAQRAWNQTSFAAR